MVTESIIDVDPELLKSSLSCDPEEPLVIDVNLFCIQSSRGDRYLALGTLWPLLPGEGFSCLTSLHHSHEVEERDRSSKSSAIFQAFSRQIKSSVC